MNRKLLVFLMMFLTGANLSAQNGGYALKFDGVDDHAFRSTGPISGLTNLTIEAWIYIDPTASKEMYLVQQREPGVFGTDGEYVFKINSDLSLDFWDYTQLNNVGYGFNDHSNSGLVLPKGTWIHIAVAVNNTLAQALYYVNGKLERTESRSGPQMSYNADLDFFIGEDGRDFADPNLRKQFKGKMDEIRVWNDVRTEAEIKANMYIELVGNEANLAVYYKMSNGSGTSLNDDKASGTYDLTISGASWKASGAFAGSRQALDFDGTNDYISIPHHASLNMGTGNFTYEYWVNTSNSGVRYDIISKENENTQNDLSILINESNQAVFYTKGTTIEHSVSSTKTIPSGVWAHIAGVRDGNVLKVYINGVLDNTSTGTAQDITNTNVLILSANFNTSTNGGNTGFFNGQLDEVRIWNTARSESQIRENMMRTLVGNESGLVAYYRFDHYDGTILYDITSNAKNGVLTNMDPANDWVPSTAFNTWLGGESNVWSNLANWSNGIPAASQSIGLYKWGLANITTYEATVSGSPTMNNLLISSGSAPTLSSGLTVNGNLLLEKDMNLNGQTVTLGPQGYLVEGNGYFSGTAGMITTTRPLNNITAQNVGGLGAILTSSANMGSTVISRGHAAQSGNVKSGILRYYDISPTSNTGLNATLVFNYRDLEMNGLTEADFKLYKSTDAGSTWWGMGGTVNTVDNQVTLGSIGSFSRWTLSDGIMSCVNPTDVGLIAGAQTICYGADPAAFTSSAPPTGHNGTLEYKWQYSTTGSPFSWNDIASSNSEVYDAQALTQTTWYRRMARVSCMADWSGAVASNVVEVTVYSLLTFTWELTDLKCFNAGDGAITITASGGSGSGYQYSIDNGSSWHSGNVFNNLQAGDYPLKVKDDAGCMSENLLIN
jgi:large repetitive protein